MFSEEDHSLILTPSVCENHVAVPYYMIVLGVVDDKCVRPEERGLLVIVDVGRNLHQPRSHDRNVSRSFRSCNRAEVFEMRCNRRLGHAYSGVTHAL